MAASYPTSVKTFTTKADGGTISASHVNDLQLEVTAIETGLKSGFAHDILFTDATYDIGKSGATRPRDFFLSRNADIGGTLGVTGASTIAALSATSGTFSTTLSVTGASTLAAISGTTGTFSGAVTSSGAGNFTTSIGLGTTTVDPMITAANKILSVVSAATADYITEIQLVGGATTASKTTARIWFSQSNLYGSSIQGFRDGADTTQGLQFGTHNVGAYNANAMSLSGPGVLTLSALASGNLTSASGVITSSSDEQLKDISGPLTYGLAEVLQLQPVRYHWNKASGIPTEPEYGGFGAEQVEAVMPLAVSYGQDGMRGLNTTVILSAAVNAFQDVDTRLRAIEAKLAMSVTSKPLASAAQIQKEIVARKAADQTVATKRLADAKVKEVVK